MSADATPNHFIRQIVLDDLEAGKHAAITTRFPPEPNGYLHIGHAKSICLNFGLAGEFNGHCNLRFDDTNPAKEELEYVEAIKEDVHWLGFQWSELRHASDYFELIHRCALKLIRDGHAYVCDLSADEVRTYRGTLTEPGRNSPFRDRTVAENLDLFARMKAGEFTDGASTLRAKIDMGSGNINLRDPALYRIRKVTHQNTGDAWCIYPMYDFAHVVSDAVEGITHSLCTLEFEDHRPLYDWCLDQLPVASMPELQDEFARLALKSPGRPRQIEFSRLNLDYLVMSKRKLLAMVNDGLVSGWDDPRMPTLRGFRRRGFTSEAIRSFVRNAGVTKQESVLEFSVLENEVRNDLDARADRRMAVIDPLKLVITNLPDAHHETLTIVNHPKDESRGTRAVPFSRELWIEREDFMEVPPKGYHRLVPGGEVRLRGVGIVRCTDVIKNDAGEISAVHGTLDDSTRHGMPGADRKIKGTIHWVSAAHAIAAETRLYDRLFTVADPDDDRDGKTYRDHLNPASVRVVTAQLEASLANISPETRFQFERLGYFVTDRVDHRADRPVFNRVCTLRDSWAKATK